MDKNLIECATCGYPLTKDERFGLIEINSKMHKPWVGLTDEEIAFEWRIASHATPKTPAWSSHIRLARAIEAKLREKNT